MPTSPPYDPILKKEYDAAPDNLRRVRILHRDLWRQPVIKEYVAASRSSASARRLKHWAPLKRIGGPHFAVAVGDAITGDGVSSGPSGYSFGHGPPRFWSQLWFRIGFVLIATGMVGVVLSILRGVRNSMIRHSEAEAASVINVLWVWSPARLESYGWLVPGIVFAARPLPILSFLSYSPAVLLGMVLFAVYFPGKKLPAILAVSVVLTVAVSLVSGLGVIPAIGYCGLLVGVLGLIGSVIAVGRSQDFIAQKNAANQFFYQNYWPMMAHMARDAGDTELREIAKEREERPREEAWRRAQQE